MVIGPLLQTAIRALVHATGGDWVTSEGVERSPLALLPSSDKVFISETLFLDAESDTAIRDRYLEKYLTSLHFMRRLAVPTDSVHVHITYCSIDKSAEIGRLSTLFSEWNLTEEGTYFLLSIYAHPADGYPTPANGHIDARKLPNKMEPLRTKNFRRAIAMLAPSLLESASTFYRFGIDDDDVWMPWALQEFDRLGTALLATPGRKVRCVGIGRQYVYYPHMDGGRLDLADMTVCMSGSKFYVSTEWAEIRNWSCWSIEESFSRNVATDYAQMGVDMSICRNGKPVLIYVRGENTLSGTDKTHLYMELIERQTEVADLDSVVIGAGRSGDPGKVKSAPIFEVDPRTLQATGTVTTTGETLQISTNAREIAAERSFGYDELRVEVRLQTSEGLQRVSFELEDPLSVPTDRLTGRTIVALYRRHGDEERQIGSAWVRGQATFLS